MSLRSSPAALASLIGLYLRLFHTERALLKSEFQSAALGMVRAVILSALAAVCFLSTFILLIQAAVAALVERGWRAQWADLCVAVTVGMLGCILLLIGRTAFRRFGLIPHRTLRQIRKDFEFAKDGVRWRRQ
jgi:hypothetical protein